MERACKNLKAFTVENFIYMERSPMTTLFELIAPCILFAGMATCILRSQIEPEFLPQMKFPEVVPGKNDKIQTTTL